MAELRERGTYDPDADDRPVRHSLNSGHDRAASKSSDPRSENTAAGNTSNPRGQGLDDVRSGENLFNKDGDGGVSTSQDSTDLRSQEQNSTSSDMFNAAGDNKNGVGGKFRSLIKRRKKTIAIGGGATGGVVAIGILLATLLIPLKIEHMVTNLQDRFFASSEQASGDALEKMTYSYFKKHVLPSYKNCGSTISKDCKVKITNSGSNPVTQLYKSWADVKLEHTFATKYNLEFQYNKRSNSWLVKGPGAGQDGVNIGPNGENLEREFKKSSRSELRQTVRKATENETFWKKIMYRFKVGRLLEQKYNLKRCMVYCSKRDQFADKVDQKKNAAKILLVQRVISPRNTAVGAVMECLMDPNCHPERTTSDPSSPGGSGEPESDYERDNRTSLKAVAAKYGSTNPEDVDKMIADYKTISDKGYGKFALSKVLEKVGIGGELSSNIAEKANVVGWVNTASKVIESLKEAGPKVKKLSYVTNSAAAVSLYMSYRTYADEIHTGKIDSTEVGSFTESLSPGNRGGANDEEAGGTAGAESSPVYKQLMDGTSDSSSISMLDSAFSAKTYADSTEVNQYSTDYKCTENKALINGTCPEEKFGNGNNTANDVSAAFSTPPLSYLATAASAWNSTAGKVLGAITDLFGSAISGLPGVSNLTDFIGKAIQPFYVYISKQLIPDPFGSNMSGARTFNMMAAGANVGGNDACTQIGCRSATPQEAVAVINRQQSNAKSEFQSQPFFARMFSTNSQYSFVSRLSMDIPLNTYAALQSNFTTIIRNPFTALSHSFSSIFTTDKAFAAASTNSADLFGVGSRVFPTNDIPDDAEAYWDAHNCGDDSENGPIAQWQKAAASPDGSGPVDPNTGMPIHTTTEPCLIIRNAAGDGGGRYDTDLLSSDEKSVLTGGGSSTSSGSSDGAASSGGLASGDAVDLAKQLLPYIQQGKIKCGSAAGGSGTADCSDIQNTAKGQAIGGNCAVKALTPNLLAFILGLVKDDGWTLGISAICSDHHAEGDGAYAGHSYGSTADFSIENGAAGAAAASNKKFVNDSAALLSKTGGSFGQKGCHANYSSISSSKFTVFDDVCNHQHIRAAPSSAKQAETTNT